jgi:hypothetical protein
MKSINRLGVIFTDKKGNILKIMTNADLKQVHTMVISFRHKHNRQRGQ